jgi:two-component system nitrogen regulation sensor histidine kinase NtrY
MTGGDTTPGRISIDVHVKNSRVIIAIKDNGIGLPSEHRHRLTEPYVTTRAKGTGLGLAIVRKILEDHAGELSIDDSFDESSGEVAGAVIRMQFPLRQSVKHEQELTHEQERVVGRA